MTCSRAPFDLSMWPISEGAQPAALRRRGAECADPDVLLGSPAARNGFVRSIATTMFLERPLVNPGIEEKSVVNPSIAAAKAAANAQNQGISVSLPLCLQLCREVPGCRFVAYGVAKLQDLGGFDQLLNILEPYKS